MLWFQLLSCVVVCVMMSTAVLATTDNSKESSPWNENNRRICLSVVHSEEQEGDDVFGELYAMLESVRGVVDEVVVTDCVGKQQQQTSGGIQGLQQALGGTGIHARVVQPSLADNAPASSSPALSACELPAHAFAVLMGMQHCSNIDRGYIMYMHADWRFATQQQQQQQQQQASSSSSSSVAWKQDTLVTTADGTPLPAVYAVSMEMQDSIGRKWHVDIPFLYSHSSKVTWVYAPVEAERERQRLQSTTTTTTTATIDQSSSSSASSLFPTTDMLSTTGMTIHTGVTSFESYTMLHVNNPNNAHVQNTQQHDQENRRVVYLHSAECSKQFLEDIEMYKQQIQGRLAAPGPSDFTAMLQIGNMLFSLEEYQEAILYYSARLGRSDIHNVDEGSLYGDIEECYYAQLMSGVSMLRLRWEEQQQHIEPTTYSVAQIADMFLHAFNIASHRVESLLWLCRLYRSNGDFAVSYAYARSAASLANPYEYRYVTRLLTEGRADLFEDVRVDAASGLLFSHETLYTVVAFQELAEAGVYFQTPSSIALSAAICKHLMSPQHAYLLTPLQQANIAFVYLRAQATAKAAVAANQMK